MQNIVVLQLRLMPLVEPSKYKEGNFMAKDVIRTKSKRVLITIVGDSDLILCKRSASYEREAVFKQSNPKGTKIPAKIAQPYNMWEKLITSIHWLNDIELHEWDKDYTEEEWETYMRTNKPCIQPKAFIDSWREGFKSFGYKDSTKKDGTDLKRTVKIKGVIPVDFAKVGYDQHIAQTSGLSKTDVLTQANVFHGWRCTIELRYMESVFPLNTILSLIADCGEMLGVGARRGEGYGSYHIVEIEEFGD